MLEPDAKADFVGQVVKITTDPKSNIKYSVTRILSGTLKGDGSVFTPTDRKGQRTGHALKLCGDQHAEIDEAGPGDVIAFAKIDVAIGEALFDKAAEGTIPMPKIPSPMFALAIEPKARGDVEKISAALHRFAEEDPCFNYERDAETNELVMQGMGDLQPDRAAGKDEAPLQDGSGHQAAEDSVSRDDLGLGQVRRVHTQEAERWGGPVCSRLHRQWSRPHAAKGTSSSTRSSAGSIDQPFPPQRGQGHSGPDDQGRDRPAVRWWTSRVSLVDGKTHPVDSKDIAFQIAGRQVFKKAFMQCKPILLEPIVTMEVTAPTDFMGDITRDLAGKRGQILGQDMLPGGQGRDSRQRAAVGRSPRTPRSSRAFTGGQGSYTMEFDRYDGRPAERATANRRGGGEEGRRRGVGTEGPSGLARRCAYGVISFDRVERPGWAWR